MSKMKAYRIIATIFILIALGLGIVFFSELSFPLNLEDYFKREYYNQFGPLAICVELLVAGIYLFRKHPKANFTLALYGFTALLDPVFNAIGLFNTSVPVYGTVLFIGCAIPALWMAFSNSFDLGRISFIAAFGSFLLGLAVELFFNYW